jgi:hypothetical protein
VPPFVATPHYNEYLPAGQDTLWVVLTVRASERLPRTAGRAEIVIVDNSGSMSRGRKMAAAKGAAAAAVDAVEDGVEFAVVVGNDHATKIWPPAPRSLAIAGPSERAGARAAIADVRPGGGTTIGAWLDLARDLFEGSPAELRHAILLSDGRNTTGAEHLEAATKACRGVFQCDCRGVGTDWSVAELRSVAEVLDGRVGLVDRIDEVGREELAEHFRRLVRDSQARVATVRLRIVTRETSDVGDFGQSAPTIVPMGDRREPAASGPRATEIALGGWAPGEVRDYTFAVEVRADHVGRVGDPPRPVAKVELVLADGSVGGDCLIHAVWTDDRALTTRVEPALAHYLVQSRISSDIRAGLHAMHRGEPDLAADSLWKAHQDALEAGDHGRVADLDKLVALDAAGTPRLVEAGDADAMHVDADSTRSLPFPRPDAPRADPSGDPS